MPRKQECLIRGCKETPHCRGLCVNCYQNTARKVRNQECTWDQLVEAKLALPAKSGRESLASKAISELAQ